MAILLLVAAPVPGWVFTVILVRAALRLREPSLQERATAAVILSTSATCIAIPSAAYLQKISLGGFGTLILIAGLLLVSLPQIVWGVAYLAGRFR
jgi:hypothetical protein